MRTEALETGRGLAAVRGPGDALSNLRTALLIALCAALLCLAIAAPAASAADAVSVARTDGGFGATAIYVDSSGAAHVAFPAQETDPSDPGGGVMVWTGAINECTIPAGATSCQDLTSRPTGVQGGDDGASLQTLKFLKAPDGSEYLVAGLYEFGGGLPVPPDAPYPYAETETVVFAPTGAATVVGSTADGGGSSGDPTIDDGQNNGQEGDAIFDPLGTGIDVLGYDGNVFDQLPGEATGQNANDFQYESLTGVGDGAPTYPGGELGGDDGTQTGDYPIDITTLPQGQVAVLAATEPKSPNGKPSDYPIGIFTQPAGGGAFGSFKTLGISGRIVTDYTASGSSYVLNVETASPAIKLAGGSEAPPVAAMELYRFRGPALVPVATVGSVDNLTIPSGGSGVAVWDTLPPTSEDSAGDFYTAWNGAYRPGSDGTSTGYDCPASAVSSNVNANCIIYRRVSSAGVPGPMVTLVANGGGDAQALGIATSNGGAGSVLYENLASDGYEHLYAAPLAAAASVLSAPATSASAVTTPLTCTGSGGGCDVSALLTATVAVSAHSLHAVSSHLAIGLSSEKKTKTVTLGKATTKISNGKRVKFVVRLNEAGRKLLAKKHKLTAKLRITEIVGVVKTPTTVIVKSVTFHKGKKK